MFALVESGTITQFPKGNKGITIGENQYPSSIYTLWTEAERNAIGIYTVEIDSTNRKDEEFYINTNITYAFGSGKVTGSYGTATAKKLADEDAVANSVSPDFRINAPFAPPSGSTKRTSILDSAPFLNGACQFTSTGVLGRATVANCTQCTGIC